MNLHDSTLYIIFSFDIIILIWFSHYRVMFDLLSRFCHSSNVGCANLTTCISSLILVAKFRVSFINKVVATLETLTSKKCLIKT